MESPLPSKEDYHNNILRESYSPMNYGKLRTERQKVIAGALVKLNNNDKIIESNRRGMR
jgi:hypothetical protein